MRMLLNQIIEVTNQEMPNDQKHVILSDLWAKVFSSTDHSMDFDVYNLYLCSENTSYIIDQPPLLKYSNYDFIQDKIKFYQTHGYFEDDVTVLLDYVVTNARQCFQKMGVDLNQNSLNGYCEISQLLTILPFEELGLSVTKNKASDCFDFPLNHVFGTVTFPIKGENGIILKTYLLDATYRQFFSTVRCHEGMYFVSDELDLYPSPNPGYFVKDITFAKTLLKDGYIELTTENAQKYGESFYLSSLKRGEIGKKRNYREEIFNHSSEFVVTDLEGLSASFFPQGHEYKSLK